MQQLQKKYKCYNVNTIYSSKQYNRPSKGKGRLTGRPLFMQQLQRKRNVIINISHKYTSFIN